MPLWLLLMVLISIIPCLYILATIIFKLNKIIFLIYRIYRGGRRRTMIYCRNRMIRELAIILTRRRTHHRVITSWWLIVWMIIWITIIVSISLIRSTPIERLNWLPRMRSWYTTRWWKMWWMIIIFIWISMSIILMTAWMVVRWPWRWGILIMIVWWFFYWHLLISLIILRTTATLISILVMTWIWIARMWIRFRILLVIIIITHFLILWGFQGVSIK